MVRFSFASPSGSNKQSRKDRLEQAKQRAADTERGRRRNFGFLKTGEKRMSTTSITRTREHAKKLAMAYSDPIEPIPETPTSVSSGQNLLGFGSTDGAGAFDADFDPFNNNNNGNNTNTATNNDFGFGSSTSSTQPNTRLDHHFSSIPESRPSAPSVASSAAESSAYDMDFLSSREPSIFSEPSTTKSSKKERKNAQSLDAFVENTTTPSKGPGSFSGASMDRSAATQERSVISMPTFPSNSSMQAGFVKPGASTPQYGMSPAKPISSAAARRRMRNFGRQGQSSSFSSSFDDASSFTSSMTPESSTSSAKFTGAPKNRIGPYPRGHSGSFYSQASITSSVNSGSSNPNLFDSQNLDGGFTFDAFGLDQSQVEREVNEALRDLAGQGMGFSVFFNNNDSDSEFPSQNWDSPANSRRSSPAPSDSESEGYVDGFRVSPSPAARPSYSSSPIMPRKLNRPIPKGATPPRWEGKASNLKQPQLNKDAFGNALNNPWKEDPWGSGDEGKAFSDSGSDFGGTKSEIVTSFQAPIRPFANFSDNRSDIGTSTAYQKSVSFRDDVRLPEPEPQYDGSSGEESEMQADLAREFAEEFVRRVSPRHANSEPIRRPPRFSDQSENDRSYDYPSQQQHPQHQMQPAPQKEMFHADFDDSGAASDYSEQQSYGAHDESHETYEDESLPSHQEPQQRQSYGYSGRPSYEHPPQTPSQPDSSLFSSFRSKYESSRAPSVPKPETPASEPQLSTTKAHSSFRSSYAAAKNRAVFPSPRSPATQVPSWQDSVEPSKEEISVAESSNSRLEEKKEEEVAPSTESLKSKWKQWESKTALKVEESPQPATVPKWKRAQQQQETPSQLMLRTTPSSDSASASQRRGNEASQERTSFASLRERLKSSSSRDEIATKSDVGGGYRSPAMASVSERLRRESPRGESMSDSKSDVGASPSFLSNARSPREAVSPYEAPLNQPVSYRERQSQDQQGPKHSSPVEQQPPEPQPAERKLTYRERRELELKREQEAKEKLQAITRKEPPKKDVAAMIRKRVAANKQKAAALKENKPQVADFRKNLKPVARPEQKPRAMEASDQDTTESLQLRTPTQASPLDEQSPRQTLGYEQSPEDEVPFDAVASTNAATNPTYSMENTQSVRESITDVQSPGQKPFPKTSPVATRPMVPSEREHEETGITPAKTKKVGAASGIAALFAGRAEATAPPVKRPTPEPAVTQEMHPVSKKNQSLDQNEDKTDVKALLSGFLGARQNPLAKIPAPKKEDDTDALMYAKKIQETSPEKRDMSEVLTPKPPASLTSGGRPALKDDPKYERYFRMLKVGMPMDVVKHAMQKDGNDPSIMDGDHNKPVGLALKEDPKYTKYFKMLKIGIPMPQVKHSMERDGLDPDVMDQDHNLPASTCEKKSKEPKKKDTHRRARLHWRTLVKITRNSLWSKIEKEPEVTEIDFDEEEFKELFQADISNTGVEAKVASSNRKKGAAVRVIDAKRANNGGIILARVKMSHDEMADVVDRIDGDALSAEQIENIIEFLPTKEERKQLEKYMLEGDQDAAEKFDGLCECEKFMVSMMTVKHAKRKVRALLFKLQFLSCLQSIAEDAGLIEDACEQLKNSSRLRQLLGIVLQFGNRLNNAGKSSKNKAGAFTLDSLLKLSQAKAFDKKTTFLHYIVMIVNRNNPTLLNFTDDLTMVMKADKVYWDQCLQDLEEVENQLENVRRISLHEARLKKQSTFNRNQDDDESLGDMELTLEEEVGALRATRTGLFTLNAIKQVSALRDKVEATRTKFVRVLEYFGEDADSMQPHELFTIFCSFGRDFNKAKEETFAKLKKKQREERKKAGLAGTPEPKQRQKTSDHKRGMPKASSMQPNMSKVIKDFRGSSSQPKYSENGLPQGQRKQRAVPQNVPQTEPSYRQNVESSANVVPAGQSSYQSRQQQAYKQNYAPATPPEPISPKQPNYSPRDTPYPQPQTDLQYGKYGQSKLPTTSPKKSTYSPKNMPYSAYKPGLQAPTPDGKSPTYMPKAVSYRPQPDRSSNPQPSVVSSPTAKSTQDSSASEALRQKARSRMQKQMQTPPSARNGSAIVSGTSTNMQYMSQVPESRSPRSSPDVVDDPAQHSAAPSPSSTHSRGSSLHSRGSMRSRRLQAMKRVSASRHSTASPADVRTS